MQQMILRAVSLAALATACTATFAQTSSVTLYGSLDQYLSYMKSSSGRSITSLNDGLALRSRIGFRGVESLGNGYEAKFNLEHGLSADTGAAADTTRFFDRQAWVGLNTPYGEFRAGRQNTAIFYRGGYIDYGARTLGSIVNNFGTPSRYDNDLSYQSPRMAGVQFEAHYAPGESTSSAASQAVYQLAVDYLNGPYRVGYANIIGKPAKGAAVDKDIVYHNLYANYDYGAGKVYGVFIRSNNSTGNANGNNATNILGAVGALVAGTNTDANRFYNIYQLSADYKLTPNLRIGALIGKIDDTSDSGRSATGGSVGAFYDLSKRTTLVALAETMKNDTNAGFRPSGSAGVSPNFVGSEVNGQTMKGIQFGMIHKF
jgi:predicted porin